MAEYQNVGTPGHVDYANAIPKEKGRVIIIDETGMRYAELSELVDVCPAAHKAFTDDLKAPAVPRLQNRETWRGKGKRRMPR